MSDPHCWAASSNHPSCAAPRLNLRIAELERDLTRLRTGIQAMYDSTEHQNIRNMCKAMLEGKP